jgi:hypothetical protein
MVIPGRWFRKWPVSFEKNGLPKYLVLSILNQSSVHDEVFI